MRADPTALRPADDASHGATTPCTHASPTSTSTTTSPARARGSRCRTRWPRTWACGSRSSKRSSATSPCCATTSAATAARRPPQAPYTLDQLADDAHGLLQHLGIARTHWLGLSMGGMIGQTLAIRHPEVLDRVVLADTTGRVPAAGAAMWADRVRIARSEGMQALEQPTLARWFTEPFRAAQPALMAADRRDDPHHAGRRVTPAAAQPSPRPTRSRRCAAHALAGAGDRRRPGPGHAPRRGPGDRQPLARRAARGAAQAQRTWPTSSRRPHSTPRCSTAAFGLTASGPCRDAEAEHAAPRQPRELGVHQLLHQRQRRRSAAVSSRVASTSWRLSCTPEISDITICAGGWLSLNTETGMMVAQRPRDTSSRIESTESISACTLSCLPSDGSWRSTMPRCRLVISSGMRASWCTITTGPMRMLACDTSANGSASSGCSDSGRPEFGVGDDRHVDDAALQPVQQRRREGLARCAAARPRACSCRSRTGPAAAAAPASATRRAPPWPASTPGCGPASGEPRRLGQHALRRLVEGDAGLRQAHAARQPLQQLRAHFGLQLAHLARQRGLRNRYGSAAAVRLPASDHGDEVTKGTQVHGEVRQIRGNPRTISS